MSNDASLLAPTPRAVAYGGGTFTVVAPGFAGSIIATGHNAIGDFSLTYQMSAPGVSAYGGANAAITAPQVIAGGTGTFVASGAAVLVAPMPGMTGSATISASGAATLTFGSLPSTYSLVGFGGAMLSATMGGVTVEATGLTGSNGSAILTLPLYDLVATGTAQNHGGGTLLMPSARMGSSLAYVLMPMGRLDAVGSATIAISYEAYAVNLNHPPAQRGVPQVDELTHYTNYPFDRIVRYKGSYFGMNATGLFLLDGTTDAGADIPWGIKTALTDFGTPQNKTVEMAYIGGRLGPSATITLFAGESGANPYAYTTPRDASAQNYRQSFGRGIKSRYVAIGLAGTSGPVVIDTLTLDVTTLTRKV